MLRFLRNHKTYICAGLGILSAFLFLRIYNLTVLPVFADEAIYIRWSQVMRSVPSLRFIPLSDGKQPLFMWVVIPFLKLLDDPLFAGRFVSVLSGLATMLGIFTLTQILFRNLRVSLVASFFYALTPFAVFFDRLALSDSMLSAFGVWTVIFLVLSAKTLRLDFAMLSGFSLGGALLTKSPGVYFALMSPVSLLVGYAIEKKKRRFLLFAKSLFLLGVTGFLGFGFYNILRLGPEFHMIAIRNKDYVYPLSHILTSPFDPLLPFLHRIFEYFWIMGPFTLVFLFLAGVYRGLKSSPKETVLLLIWAIVPIFASAEFSKTMTARYVYFSVPYILIISSFLLFNIRKSFGSLLVFLFTAQSVLTNFYLVSNPQKAGLPRSERSGYLEEWTAGYGIREISDLLKREAATLSEGKQIVVGTEGYFGTLPDGLQIYLNINSKVTVIGVGQPVREVHQSLLDSIKAGNKTYLVVNDSRLLVNPDDYGLRLLTSYPKAFKPDGTQEKLLFFELTEN